MPHFKFIRLAGRSPVLSYVIAVLAVTAGVAIASLLPTTAPVGTFLLAVIVGAWFGGIRPGLLATGLSLPALAYFLPPVNSWTVETEQLPRLAYFLFIASFTVWVIASLRRAHAELQQQNEVLAKVAGRLQHLSRRLLEVQEEERRHLSRELHDEFGQLLVAISLRLHAAKGAAGEAAQGSLEESIALLQRAGEQVRSLAFSLRPAILETAGLDGTLRWLAEQHEQQTGMPTHVIGQLPDDVPEDVATACFRVAQQALTNVVQHTKARQVWIELGQYGGRFELVIRDDGAGFEVASTLEHAPSRGHLGLLGMRERVQNAGGTLHIDSEPWHGTRIRASFPLARTAKQPAEDVA